MNIRKFIRRNDEYLDLTEGATDEVTMQDFYENLEYHGMKIVKV